MRCDISVYGIVDPQIARGRSLVELAVAAARGGATVLQYRAKHAGTRAMVEAARAIRDSLAGTGIPLIVNDRADVALAANADGVHLGPDDLDPREARALLGARAIIGVSVKTEADIARLRDAPIDHAFIGAVYATTHKDDATSPMGVAGFRALRMAARDGLGPLPVGAIGGITPANAGALFNAGAQGVAVIGAIFAGDDPESAARDLARAIAAARR